MVDASPRRATAVNDVVVATLAGAWGVVAAAPIVRRARRGSIVGRFGRATPPKKRRLRLDLGPVGRVARGLSRRRSGRRRAEILDRALPPALDLLIVAVRAGSPPRQAVEVAARWSSAPVAEPLRRVLVATDLGGSLAEALDEMAAAVPLLGPIADVLTTSARLGAPAADALARLADESRAQARRRAEARARVLPVKLLFPLVFLVLPAFALLTVAPALLSALARL